MVCHPSTSNFLIFNFIENLIPRHFSNNAIFHSAQFSSGKVQLCAIHWKNGGKIRRISTFFVSTHQNSALSLVAACSVCQEKLKIVIVDSSTRTSNSIITEFLFNFYWITKQARSHGMSFQLGASLFSSQKKISQHPKKDFLRKKILRNSSSGGLRAIFLFSAENVRGGVKKLFFYFCN